MEGRWGVDAVARGGRALEEAGDGCRPPAETEVPACGGWLTGVEPRKREGAREAEGNARAALGGPVWQLGMAGQ